MGQQWSYQLTTTILISGALTLCLTPKPQLFLLSLYTSQILDNFKCFHIKFFTVHSAERVSQTSKVSQLEKMLAINNLPQTTSFFVQHLKGINKAQRGEENCPRSHSCVWYSWDLHPVQLKADLALIKNTTIAHHCQIIQAGGFDSVLHQNHFFNCSWREGLKVVSIIGQLSEVQA